MATDVLTAAEFYSSRKGAVAARLLRARLAAMWPNLAGKKVLGIGYPAPYLRQWRDEAQACIALTPSQIGIASWPIGQANMSCTAEEDALPFADRSVDRVILVHGLEAAERVRPLLREIWRVLSDDGRLLVVTPNRSGMWAHLESTPFGQGQPYSAGQIARLLHATMFREERRDTALFVPPTDLRIILRAAPVWERSGRRLLPGFAGVTITEASKDLYAIIPLQRGIRRTDLAEAVYRSIADV